MFFNSKLFFILFSSLILIIGCGSSVEYSTAKVAIQDKDWAKAEEYLFKALEVEPENAAVMVDIGYYVHSKKREWQKMNEMFDKALAINPAARAQNGRPIPNGILYAHLNQSPITPKRFNHRGTTAFFPHNNE